MDYGLDNIDAVASIDHENDVQFDCPICLNSIGQGETSRTTICGHRFCCTCIERWFSSHCYCPLCKTDLGARGGGYVQSEQTSGEGSTEYDSILPLLRSLTGFINTSSTAYTIPIGTSASYTYSRNAARSDETSSPFVPRRHNSHGPFNLEARDSLEAEITRIIDSTKQEIISAIRRRFPI
ncbi:RING finger domain-containing protein [Tetraselmis virus 1]|uniref:RING finger domain-containing protein n=1 Tax=Tetraselmis virus 1 TaxID=2060617 RepID=A0A2P0VP47_9VIRU|nr:RING finger domain-containing protein [Tetraselmis virus 1]AUF82630.1 RING finger domain-containing protein [Tetraselmis virus 1]